MNGKSEADWMEMLRHRINSSCLAQQWFEVKFFAVCFIDCHGAYRGNRWRSHDTFAQHSHSNYNYKICKLIIAVACNHPRRRPAAPAKTVCLAVIDGNANTNYILIVLLSTDKITTTTPLPRASKVTGWGTSSEVNNLLFRRWQVDLRQLQGARVPLPATP